MDAHLDSATWPGHQQKRQISSREREGIDHPAAEEVPYVEGDERVFPYHRRLGGEGESHVRSASQPALNFLRILLLPPDSHFHHHHHPVITGIIPGAGGALIPTRREEIRRG